MKVDRIYGAFFSGTDTTKKTVTHIAKRLAGDLILPLEIRDFTLPQDRKEPLVFEASSLVILGMPTIAGRVPNLLLPYLRAMEGEGCLCVPVVMFGNRSFDNSLIELHDLCIDCGMKPIAAAGLVGEHSFSTTLGKGRPDSLDFAEIDGFISRVESKLHTLSDVDFSDIAGQLDLPGKPAPDYGGYYMPQDRNGKHIDIRKVKPVTDEDRCTDCKICYEVCPMNAIDYDNVTKVPGICMKCCACIKKCPEQAKSFTDPGYLYHKRELEALYKRRASNSFFV